MDMLKTEGFRKKVIIDGTEAEYGCDNISLLCDGFNVIYHKKREIAFNMLSVLGVMESPSSGKIFINNIDISKLLKDEMTIFRRRNIGIFLNEYDLVPGLNVYENITMVLKLDGCDTDIKYMVELCELLNISGILKRNPEDITAKDQFLVKLARAMSNRPLFIIAEEPVRGVNPNLKIEIIGLLQVLSKEYNQCVIFVSNNNEYNQFADRIIRVNRYDM